jgi:hypothetical protein
MKKYALIITAAVLALVFAIVMFSRERMVKKHFDATVKSVLATSEGYDQRFIDMVNKLEQELAQRASFWYSGGKDPMTGTIRKVVQAPATVMKDGKVVPVSPAAAADPVKLTAIIADASGKKVTAVVMDGERSYSVETGEVVAGRKISRISNEGIYMENDSMYYFYDIHGEKASKYKDGFPKKPGVAPAAPVTPVTTVAPAVKPAGTQTVKPAAAQTVAPAVKQTVTQPVKPAVTVTPAAPAKTVTPVTEQKKQ